CARCRNFDSFDYW
nr:immunoglobulin heavy chain junction region [Mus musculus]